MHFPCFCDNAIQVNGKMDIVKENWVKACTFRTNLSAIQKSYGISLILTSYVSM